MNGSRIGLRTTVMMRGLLWSLGAAIFTTLAPFITAGPNARLDAAETVAQSSLGDGFTIASRNLAGPRKVMVSLPPSHGRTDRPYPVVVVLDGELNFEPTVTTAETLARLGHIPEPIIVGVPNASSSFRDRAHDMTPPGLSVSGSSLEEGGDRFLDFLEDELLPEIRRRYRGGAPAVLIGHSHGGVIATYAAATRRAFPVVIAIDAPIHLGRYWLAEKLMQRGRAERPGNLRYVSIEARFGWQDEHWTRLKTAAPASWRLERRALQGESHETMLFLATYEGLKHAFGDYSIVAAPIPPRGIASDAYTHYSEIAASFGSQLPPPAAVLRQLIEDLLIEGRPNEARRALRWLTEGYGESRSVGDLEKMIDRAAALPPLEETLTSLLATPFPTVTEIAPYEGEWRGEMWMTPAEKSEIGLRISIADGNVTAEAINWLPDGTTRARPVRYLRVLPDRLEYGVMNGMRPMGLLVFSGDLAGQSLKGTQGFRGIVLPLPDGHMPPEVHFQLNRVKP